MWASTPRAEGAGDGAEKGARNTRVGSHASFRDAKGDQSTPAEDVTVRVVQRTVPCANNATGDFADLAEEGTSG